MDAIEAALDKLMIMRLHHSTEQRHIVVAMVRLARAELAALRAQAEPVGCGGDKSTLRVVTDSWKERE